MPKNIRKQKDPIPLKTNVGIKKSKRRGQKLKDSEMRARLDKVVQERDDAQERGYDPDKDDKENVPDALSRLVTESKKSVTRKQREPEQLNDILGSLNGLTTGVSDDPGSTEPPVS